MGGWVCNSPRARFSFSVAVPPAGLVSPEITGWLIGCPIIPLLEAKPNQFPKNPAIPNVAKNFTFLEATAAFWSRPCGASRKVKFGIGAKNRDLSGPAGLYIAKGHKPGILNGARIRRIERIKPLINPKIRPIRSIRVP
jgi:hypothetical protein